MFYDLKILNYQRGGVFAVCWIAATRGINKVKRDDILKMNIPQLCEKLLEYIGSASSRPSCRLSLCLAAKLVNGTVKVFHKQVVLFEEEILKILTTTKPVIIPKSVSETPDEPLPKMKPKRKRVNRKAEEVPSQLEKISPPDIQAIPEEPPIITMKMLELALQSTRQSMKDITLREEVPLHRSILIEGEEEGFGKTVIEAVGVQVEQQEVEGPIIPVPAPLETAAEKPPKRPKLSKVPKVQAPIVVEALVHREPEPEPIQAQPEPVQVQPEPEPEPTQVPPSIVVTAPIPVQRPRPVPSFVQKPNKELIHVVPKRCMRIVDFDVAEDIKFPREGWLPDEQVVKDLASTSLELEFITPFVRGVGDDVINEIDELGLAHSTKNSLRLSISSRRPSLMPTIPTIPTIPHEPEFPVEVQAPIEQEVVGVPTAAPPELVETQEFAPPIESTRIAEPGVGSIYDDTIAPAAFQQAAEPALIVTEKGEEERYDYIIDILRRWNFEVSGYPTLEDVSRKPLNRFNIATTFATLLAMKKMRYVDLITEDDSLFLRHIQLGPRFPKV